jgi:nucleosome binding factor SPN SPT16 subunit
MGDAIQDRLKDRDVLFASNGINKTTGSVCRFTTPSGPVLVFNDGWSFVVYRYDCESISATEIMAKLFPATDSPKEAPAETASAAENHEDKARDEELADIADAAQLAEKFGDDEKGGNLDTALRLISRLAKFLQANSPRRD